MSTTKHEHDCTSKCCYRPHGNQITAALTKRSMPDGKVAAFIAKCCMNFANNVDDLGRSALHLAASVDRYTILEWLLNHGANINIRDYESGSTALHRAIYYGCIDCAVLLMRYGADLDILDGDTRCAMQNVCRLSDIDSKERTVSLNDLLVWGSNKNYNLGIDNDTNTMTPQSVEYFRKEHILIEKIALGAYHSLFLDKRSLLYTVGHGKGGRLGNSNENSQPTPKKVKVPMKNIGEQIICISASRYHSLVLTNHSAVFACGINESHQLGVRQAGDKLTVFKEVVTLRELGVQHLIRVIARDEHSLAYSSSSIYCWGTNRGQLNVDENVKVVPLPKLMRLPPRTDCQQISRVESNDCATVVVTKENVILLFHNYKMRTIRTPNFEALKSISLVGGDSAKPGKGSITALKLLMLTQTNVIFLWYEMKQQFFKCIFSHIRLTQIDKIFYSSNQVLILSQGDVYYGRCNQIPIPASTRNDEELKKIKTKKPSSDSWSRCENNQTEISQDYMIRMDLQRSPHIDRAVDIFCNYDFTSFAVLQESNMKYFKLPQLPPEEYTFKKLFIEAHYTDAVHDVIIHVDGEVFPAHKLILYSRAPGLQDLFCEFIDKDIYLTYDRLSGKMFELLMKFIYMNYLPNESDLQDIQISLGPDSPETLLDACELYLEFAELFRITNLIKYLQSFIQSKPFHLNQIPHESKYRFNPLRLKDFPELYDVKIVCAGNGFIHAHKCILVARLEYFEMMFSHTWAEQNTINLSTVPQEYMQPIIEFLYSCDVESFRKQNYSENFLYNMIIYCDQFFIERLREICELLFLEKISIRKCCDMLDFACIYNCEILKTGCMEFICQNLARILNARALEQCEPDALKCINKHYRKLFMDVFDYRMITPDADAIDDDLLMSFVDDFEVDLNYRMDDKQHEKMVNKTKSKDLKNQNYGARQYERDAITSMLESLKVAEQSDSHISTATVSQTCLEAQKIAKKIEEDAKAWMRVFDKRDHKLRSTLDNALKANETVSAEEKQRPQYIPLSKASSDTVVQSRKTPEKIITTPIKATTSTPNAEQEITSSTPKSYNFNLADLKATPRREKLSQKQRKRLPSGSEANKSNETLGKLVEPTTPITVPAQPNAWGTLPQSPITPTSPIMYENTPPTGSSSDPTSFANMARRRSELNNTNPSPRSTDTSNSFSKILEEERKQRDYYERMRNKSLVLTQIEEQAIAELRDFYNADNASDEIITIERKSVPRTMNFAVWHRN